MTHENFLKARNVRTRKRVPYKKLIKISADGEFILMNPQAIHLPNKERSEFRKFIRYAFDHHEELHELYPVKGDEDIIPNFISLISSDREKGSSKE